MIVNTSSVVDLFCLDDGGLSSGPSLLFGQQNMWNGCRYQPVIIFLFLFVSLFCRIY